MFSRDRVHLLTPRIDLTKSVLSGRVDLERAVAAHLAANISPGLGPAWSFPAVEAIHLMVSEHHPGTRVEITGPVRASGWLPPTIAWADGDGRCWVGIRDLIFGLHLVELAACARVSFADAHQVEIDAAYRWADWVRKNPPPQ